MNDMETKLQVGVKILLRNKENKFLLLKRSTEKYKNTKGVWDIVGGRIELGASLIENLKREIREETRLEFSGKAYLVAAQDIFREGLHVVRLTYVGEMEGTPILDGDHTDYKWLTFSEMKQLDGLDVYVKELIDKNVLHETYS
jgi:ADP-ribose pyrophosphatase YjhB (NUDIX family)